MSSINSLSPEMLVGLVGVPHGHLLIDVRTDEDFTLDPRLVPGALRRSQANVASGADQFAGKSAVVIRENPSEERIINQHAGVELREVVVEHAR